MARAPFVHPRRVGFGDCDPAQIVYTGRIADFALEAIDAFWDDLLDGQGWFHMNVEQGIGMPFVRMEVDFRVPVTPRARLDCLVEPARIGRTSVALRVTGGQDGTTCFTAAFVSVFARTRPVFGKIDVPAPVRAALEARYPGLAGA